MSVAELSRETAAPPAFALYRAIWRWHFYAGLLVLPFLFSLAVTGSLYLFKDEINAIVYAKELTVAPSDAAMLAPSEIVKRAQAAVPGTAFRYAPPEATDRSAEVGIDSGSQGRLSVFVNPHTGEVLGQFADSGSSRTPLMQFIKKIHSLDYFGWLPNRVIEIVAGWTLVLVITGFYLWWPRGQRGGVMSIRQRPPQRVFWRDLHAVTGALAGALIFFLAITGLPWSGFWGAKLNSLADQYGLGYPAQFFAEVPKSDAHAAHMGKAMTQTSWSLENAPMPQSGATMGEPIGLDTAVAIFDGLGISKGYIVDLPQDGEGVYSASVFPDQVAGERVIHLDQYSGAPLFDGGFAELGPVGKTIEFGVSVHQGQEFGRVNQLVMLAACLAIIAMSVSAIVMWWKRRPKGTLGAPRYPQDMRIPRTILIIACAVGLIFPLVGLTLLLALAADIFAPKLFA
ncbi:PepSY domain-containing protein [Nordella sp. HKS 07]|uniref:PepSY-associated TM helix domain-containing protein n=1 Tax=Nordella sp. HKS 07 TaxID=2712222 RepID=UPI0013E17BD5|nr:PepSY domain-containing protein [Nordella sp. HKS 07]QIG46388.1 PepSY domain-containing protein [Nordella sp. HKS 07]